MESQCVERFPSTSHHDHEDEPMDTNSSTNSPVDQNCSSYLNLNYSNFTENDSVLIRRSSTVRKRLFIETVETSSEEQSNCPKRFKEDYSSASSSSDDEGSAYNSLLFNMQRSNKRKIDYLDSSPSSSDDDDSSTTIKNHLMDSNDEKCSISSVDYSIKDYDYTSFREELSIKIAEESFAVSTENEFSDTEEFDISIQSNKFAEEICANYITDFIEDILNDIIISTILGVDQRDKNFQNSQGRGLDDIAQQSSEQIIENIIDEVIDELIESIELNNVNNIVENSIEKIIDDILDDIISSLPVYKTPDESTTADSVKQIIEEVFGENTYSSLQNIVYDFPENNDFMECEVAAQGPYNYNEIVEQMSISHNSASSEDYLDVHDSEMIELNPELNSIYDQDSSQNTVAHELNRNSNSESEEIFVSANQSRNTSSSDVHELNRDSEMLEPNSIYDQDSSLIEDQTDINDSVARELRDSDSDCEKMNVSKNSVSRSRDTSSSSLDEFNRDSERLEPNPIFDQDSSLIEDQTDINDSVAQELNKDSDSECQQMLSVSQNSVNKSGDTSSANDSVVNDLNRDSDSESETMEPNPIVDQESCENTEMEKPLVEDQLDTNNSVHELNIDSDSERVIMEPNPSFDQDISQNTEKQSTSDLILENDSNENNDVMDYMLRNFSEMKNSTMETRESEPNQQPVQEYKPILQESTKQNVESKINIAVTSNHIPLSHERLIVDSLVTASAPLFLKPRPKFDDLPMCTSSFLSVRHKKGLRAIMSNSELSVETKNAQKNERKRTMLIKSKKEMMEELNTDGSSLALDFDSQRREFVTVHPKIVESLKNHQVEGLKFLYDCCFVGVDTLDTFPGSGAILAHCMGLGKTLTLIALIHTIAQYDKLGTKRILVLCPKSTVMNWVDEIVRWTGSIDSKTPLKSFVFPDDSNINHKISVMNEWHNSGSEGSNHAGVLLCGYEAFRGLVNRKYQGKGKAEKKNNYIKSIINKTLLKPGADLVVCDEGHILKNDTAATSLTITQVQTKRRIILTGTPIQNNLTEYFCMVDFVKPSFLGSKREFKNIYANPIKKGEAKDSTPMEIRKMKEQSYILNRKMSPFVHRREQSVLEDYLPEKIEYVISVPITDIQVKLYKHFLGVAGFDIDVGGKSLIGDYNALRKIWTHPKIVEVAYNKALVTAQIKEARRTKIINAENEEEDFDRNDSNQSNRKDLNRFKDVNSVTSTWWRSLIKRAELESIQSSNKMILLFEILKKCKARGEKCLIFSAFVTVLNCVEHFMKQIQEKHENNSGDGFENFEGPWVYGTDFYRIDGQTSRTDRYKMIKKFNSKENKRTVCFLISAKAGGQGINLTGASRAIILDTSWNPATDQQCIFRIYRLGQEKTCYIYRLLSMGTMEEKIYSRSVTKQALSGRVVDKRVIDGKFTKVELHELYTLTLTDYNFRPIPVPPKDTILLELLCERPRLAFQYHEHDTLLEHNQNEALSDAEKLQAWQSDLTKSRRGDDDFPQSTSVPIDDMVASIMSNIYENTDRPEVLSNLSHQLSENKENIQQFNLPETFTSQNLENINRTDALNELTNLVNVSSHNSEMPTVNLLATTSSIDADLSDMMPIESELVQNLCASTSVIDLTPDTQYDSDVAIVNSPPISKRPKPVVIDLTDSQPEFDMSSLMQQTVTTNNSPNCSTSRLAKKRKQQSILQYAVKSPKFTEIIPIKKEKKQLNVPLKIERYKDEMDDYFDEPRTSVIGAIDEEFDVQSPEAIEEVGTDDLIEYSPYSPGYTTALLEDLRISPMEEEEAPVPETIEELRTVAMEEEETTSTGANLSETPLTENDSYGYNPTASIDEMENISKISFSENLDIDFDLFLQNWNTETLNTDFNSNEENNSQDLIPSVVETDNLPMLPVVEESNDKTDEIEEADNLLCSENIEMENLTMPYYNSENFNLDIDFQSNELNSLKADESEVDSL